MGQRPNELTPHQSLRHYWGAELRALRIAHGLSLAELGNRLHCDPSYLAKIERAERSIPAALADSCDRALHTDGTLVRPHTLAESGKDLTTTPCHQPFAAHVAGDHGDVANSAGNLADGTSFPAVPDTGEEIAVPARTSDGRVVFVSVPRRVLLQALGSAAVGLAAAPIPSTTRHVAQVPAVDAHPVEHFQQLRQVLVDNDWMFGPRQVITIVREQIGIMQQRRSSLRGADQRELVRVQAQYSGFCGWLYQDAGDQ